MSPSYTKSILKALNVVRLWEKWNEKWICEDVLVELIHAHAQEYMNVESVDIYKLNLTFGSTVFSYVNDLCSPNHVCVYRNNTRIRFYNKECNRIQCKRVYYYFLLNIRMELHIFYLIGATMHWIEFLLNQDIHQDWPTNHHPHLNLQS